jgi:RNA polymerase sigma factor (sigma-70 family)
MRLGPGPQLRCGASEDLLEAARSGKPGARARFVSSLMPLIASVARTYSHVPSVDRAELMQEGVVGVLRALERYDPAVGSPFWAYASWWVRQAMQQLVAEVSHPVVLSDRALRQVARIRREQRALASAQAHEPGPRELAHASGVTVEQLQRLSVADRQARSLQEPVDDGALGGATLGDLVADGGAEEPYEEVATHTETEEIPLLLSRLSDRERAVVEAHFSLRGPPRTLREIGREIGVSAERVRQIEQCALDRMRLAHSNALKQRPSGAPARLVRRRAARQAVAS